MQPSSPDDEGDFDEFVRSVEPRLRRALVAAYGPLAGRDATVDALAWAWAHWDRLRPIANPAGYLYRVGQTAARDTRRAGRRADQVARAASGPGAVGGGGDAGRVPWIEPQLDGALDQLTEPQRVAVVLCHGFEWTQREVAELLGLSPSSIQNHVERGLAKLRRAWRCTPMLEPSDPFDLPTQLRAWADAVPPVTAAEARRLAEGGAATASAPPSSRRPWLLGAAAVLALVAGAVGVLALRQQGEDDRVRTTDEPMSTSTATTADPTPGTTTTVPGMLPPRTAEPTRWVGVDLQRRLVIADAVGRAEPRVLEQFDAPTTIGPDGVTPPTGDRYVGSIDVSPDGTAVYVSVLGPGEGIVERRMLDEDTDRRPLAMITVGYDPAVSPDGTKLAVIEDDDLKVVDLASGDETRYPQRRVEDGGEPGVADGITWSPDGTAVAISLHGVGGPPNVDLVVVELDDGPDAMADATVVARHDADGDPRLAVFLDDDQLLYVRQLAQTTEVVPGPGRYEVVERHGAGERWRGDLGHRVNYQRLDPARTTLLQTLGDGSVVAWPVPHDPAGPGGDRKDAARPLAFDGYLLAVW